MEWALIVAFFLVFAVYFWALRGEGDAAKRRTRDHVERGGRVSDAPDWTPGHGGGHGG